MLFLAKLLNFKAQKSGVMRYFIKSASNIVPGEEEPKFSKVEDFERKKNTALDLIRKTLKSYGNEKLLLCYNGGKDCTVLLDMLDKCCKQLELPPIEAVYIKSELPFEEVEEFVEESTAEYKIKLHKYSGELKRSLQHVLLDLPKVRAMYLGCRRSDPQCQQYNAMMPTDANWPEILRIFPLLEWSYHDIWHYLRNFDLKYCKLYDQGYTSLGEKTNTTTNPNLLFYNEKEQKYAYRPAHELTDLNLERANRLDKPDEKNWKIK